MTLRVDKTSTWGVGVSYQASDENLTPRSSDVRRSGIVDTGVLETDEQRQHGQELLRFARTFPRGSLRWGERFKLMYLHSFHPPRGPGQLLRDLPRDAAYVAMIDTQSPTLHRC